MSKIEVRTRSETSETLVQAASGGILDHPIIDRVVELMPGFVYVFNHETYSNDYTNRSVAGYLGYTGAQIKEFGAQMMLHVIHPEDHLIVDRHMERIVELEGEETVTIDYRVITKDGEERWLRSVDGVFDRSADGAVLRHIGYAQDITVEKQGELALKNLNAELESKVAERTADIAQLNAELEQRIEKRTKQLEEAIVELEQLTFIATHDLKVPANNLSRLALMLKQDSHASEAERAELISWINTSADQLHGKIQGLVLVAQIRLSSSLPIKTLNLYDEVVTAIEGLKSLPVTPISPISVEIPKEIEIDFSRFELGSILTSTLENAFKYAEPDRPLSIEIKASTQNGHAILTVADNGTGLDGNRDVEKVFGLFQRAHKSPPGNGISMYCAQRMLQRRGGSITVDGARGYGAVFTIKFPMKGQHDDTN